MFHNIGEKIWKFTAPKNGNLTFQSCVFVPFFMMTMALIDAGQLTNQKKPS